MIGAFVRDPGSERGGLFSVSIACINPDRPLRLGLSPTCVLSVLPSQRLALPHQRGPTRLALGSQHPVSHALSRSRRREFLRLGLTGLAGLTWPGLLRLRAERPAPPRADTALLVVWLHGGASHLETYDPKPDAPAEYRGPYRPIATTVPGVRVSELLPEHARVAHRFTLLRSLAHTGPCHDSGPQQLFTGFPITVNKLKPDHPDLFAIVDRLRADPSRPLPNNVGVPPIPYLGSAYLGPAHEPFAVHGDPNDPKFEVPNIGLKDPEQVARLDGRVRLRDGLDRLSRQTDTLAKRDGFDEFRGQAVNVLTGPQARRAFDLSREDPTASATATAGTPGASGACWPAGWSRPASIWSPWRSTAPCAGGCRTGTTTPSTTTSSTR